MAVGRYWLFLFGFSFCLLEQGISFLSVRSCCQLDVFRSTKACCLSDDDGLINYDTVASRQVVRRIPQIRKLPSNNQPRKPNGYWLNLTNVKVELRNLWAAKNVSIDNGTPPPIPNSSLLNYWKRHDLQGVIAAYGGRQELSELLGGSPIIPGKWTEAVQTRYLKQLLKNDSNLRSDMPPLSPQQLKQKVHSTTATATKPNEHQYEKRNAKRRSPSSKYNGPWSKTKVIQELYQYLDQRCIKQQIPAVWMPRRSELIQDGRNDLAMAIDSYFGSFDVIARKAGLISFREWNYFEGLFDMMLELKAYSDRYHDGDYKVFPVVSHLDGRGCRRLSSLIRQYGGQKFLASRLDMEPVRTKEKRKGQDLACEDMNWGPFDLEFGIELLEFVRNESLRKRPPLKCPEIRMPSRKKLLSSGETGILLDKKVQEYGGYENVARRLGLAFFG